MNSLKFLYVPSATPYAWIPMRKRDRLQVTGSVYRSLGGSGMHYQMQYWNGVEQRSVGFSGADWWELDAKLAIFHDAYPIAGRAHGFEE